MLFQITQVRQITKDTNMAKIIRASFGSKCPITGQAIHPGDRICLYTQAQHDACIEKSAADSPLPYEICEKIMDEARKQFIGRWCKEAAIDVFVLTTRSGRASRKPTDQLDRTFVKGSGFTGCDTYDRNYFGQDQIESDTQDKATEEDDAFIDDTYEEAAISDSDEEEEEDEDEEDEEEWASDEEDDDEDSEWEADEDEDEDDDE